MQSGPPQIRVLYYLRFLVLILLQGELNLLELLLRLQNLQLEPLLHRLSLGVRSALGPRVDLTLASLALNATPMQVLLEVRNLLLDLDVLTLLEGLLLPGVAVSSSFPILAGPRE